MANLKNKLFCIFLSITSLITYDVYGYDLEVDGIRYNITSIEKLTVAVEGVKDGCLDVTIPTHIEYKGKTLSVTEIASNAFSNSNIEHVKIGSNIEVINNEAFRESHIQEIEISSTTTKIGDYAFKNCINLKKLYFQDGKSLISISRFDPFSGCPLEEIYLGRTIDDLYRYIFNNLSHLTKVTIGKMCSRIPDDLFNGAKMLESITIPGNVLSIGLNAFVRCNSLTEIKLEYGPSKLSISDTTFPSSIKNVYVNREIEKIKDYDFIWAFSNNAIKNLYIGTDISQLIGFYDCSFTDIEIPANISVITTFRDCYINRIICHSSIPPTFVDSAPFSNNVYAVAKLIVPEESIDLYKNADIWKYFFEIEGMTAIEDIESETPIDKTSDVYDLAGRVVLKKATSDDINNLDKGIYIVNGKKICIK